MKKRNIICLLLAVLTLLSCAACGGKTNTGDTAGTRTITDGKNRTVSVPEKVERIVCVGVGALRYSCYVGAADRVAKTGYKLIRENKIESLKVGRSYRIPKAHLLSYMRLVMKSSSVS